MEGIIVHHDVTFRETNAPKSFATFVKMGHSRLIKKDRYCEIMEDIAHSSHDDIMNGTDFRAIEAWHAASWRGINKNGATPIVDLKHFPPPACKYHVVVFTKSILKADRAKGAAIVDKAILLR